jgi:hypothetical protein
MRRTFYTKFLRRPGAIPLVIGRFRRAVFLHIDRTWTRGGVRSWPVAFFASDTARWTWRPEKSFGFESPGTQGRIGNTPTVGHGPDGRNG